MMQFRSPTAARRRAHAFACAFALVTAIAPPLAQAQHDMAVTSTPGASGDGTKFRFLFDPLAAWPASVTWNYNATGAPAAFSNASTVTSAMQQVVASWASVCNIEAVYGGPTGVAPENTVIDAENGAQPDLVNVLGWKATPAGISGYTIAHSGWTEGGGLAPIIDADIVIDPVKVTTGAFLSRLLLHEFGHLLGVNHSQLNGTLMSGPPYSDYNSLSALTPDDIRACRCLYGAPPGVSAGVLCSAPPLLDFGTQNVGASSQKSFQIGNLGNAPVSIISVTASPSSWQASGCGAGATLGQGVNCTMQVTFTPGSAGDQSGFLTIDVGESTPYRIRLLGAGSGGASSPFASNPASLDFGPVPIATSSAVQRVTISNPGQTTVTIAGMQFQGLQANEFTRSGLCKPGQNLPPNGVCTTDIGFRPAASGPRSAELLVSTGDGRAMTLSLQGSGLVPLPTPEPVRAQPVNVIEYYHAGTDHYFVTIGADEIAALDTGLFPGWVRTGLGYKAYAVAQPGFSPICRFWLPAPANSHFYSANPSECAVVQQIIPNAILESTAVMYLALPNPVSGVCAAGTKPVYRVWNHRADTNHRYMTDKNLRDQMVAQGFVPEGSGPDMVVLCAPM
ncbi:MAG: choice-of-anchor D domain-containing protein [Betaproteobacteria bacterium PRO3]|nr:choice-of-anchor D domain-containing protein [Betaproteobacteria bacterium PRO3]